jgi:sec-independent protein translocase protein TatC
MSDPERTLTFTGHLDELRKRLIVVLVAWFVATAVSFPLAPKAIGLLTHPLEAATKPKDTPRLVFELVPGLVGADQSGTVVYNLENYTSDTKRLDLLQVDIRLPNGQLRSIGEGAATGQNFVYHKLTDPIWLIFKAALILGVILALPIWVYQIYAFVSPGLKKSEKRVLRPLFAMSSILFPCGVVFAYYMLGIMIRFLLSIQIARVAPFLTYTDYAGLAIKVMIGFGIAFELPVIVLLLTRLGVVTPAMLRKYRSHSWVGIAVISMLITPPDPFTMVLMMGPLFALYELSVWLSYGATRKAAEADDD